jgi:hypothetical protein
MPAERSPARQRARPRDALHGYLEAITGDEPGQSMLEVRPMLLGGGAAPERCWVPVDQLAEVERCVRLLAPQRQVYLGVAPRVRRAGTADAVERVWTLWADLDTEDAIKRLRTFRPLPSIVVRSGSGGAHAYWPLSEPLPPAWAQRANRRLALGLAADINATDAARILRPPGTLNHKRTPPVPVVCTRLEPVTFTAAEVVGRLPDSHHYRRSVRRRRLACQGARHPERVLEGLARTVAEAREGGRNAALYWAACRAFEHVAAGELDERHALDELSMAALATGLGGGEIRATIGSAERTTREAA